MPMKTWPWPGPEPDPMCSPPCSKVDSYSMDTAGVRPAKGPFLRLGRCALGGRGDPRPGRGEPGPDAGDADQHVQEVVPGVDGDYAEDRVAAAGDEAPGRDHEVKGPAHKRVLP